MVKVGRTESIASQRTVREWSFLHIEREGRTETAPLGYIIIPKMVPVGQKGTVFFLKEWGGL